MLTDPKYDNIRPYTEDEAKEAMMRLCRSRLLGVAGNRFYPDMPEGYLQDMVARSENVYDFQKTVMADLVMRILKGTSDGLTFSGLEYFKSSGAEGKANNFLLLSTHRDIVLDPALIDTVMCLNGLPCVDIAAGDNLLANAEIEDAMRINRMVKVIRSSDPREVYTTSCVLSEYIRERIAEGESIWLAHRQGRTKDGNDRTEQGLIKMLDMSGNGSFTESFAQLRIMPVAISYEYESCGALKALELYTKEKEGVYHKKEGEDVNSMVQGFLQPKGHIHIAFGEPLTEEEIGAAAAEKGNNRYRALAQTIDRRLFDLYRLWPTNYIAADMLSGDGKYLKQGCYTSCDRESFEQYITGSTKGMPGEVAERLVKLYAAHLTNPVQ